MKKYIEDATSILLSSQARVFNNTRSNNGNNIGNNSDSNSNSNSN